jgi:beta-phosphoglucomutase family hydrolase
MKENVTNCLQKSNITRAVIWDMDGVLVDTAPFHLKTWQETFQKKGVTFTEDDFRRNFGQRADAIVRNTLGQALSQDEVDAIVEQKNRNFRRAVRHSIKPLPGAIELIKLLAESGFRIALASSAPVENIRLLTETLGIYHLFQSIISGRDVPESKPSPQLFLLAARRLGVAPENCVVIEDAIAGVTAARRAGMHCVAVTSTNSRERLQEADLIVDTLESVTVEELERLLCSDGLKS